MKTYKVSFVGAGLAFVQDCYVHAPSKDAACKMVLNETKGKIEQVTECPYSRLQACAVCDENGNRVS